MMGAVRLTSMSLAVHFISSARRKSAMSESSDEKVGHELGWERLGIN
jgi:hypothetical protein